MIPCRPTAFDLAAVSNAVETIRAAKKKAVLVLSACPFLSPEIAETRAVLEQYGFCRYVPLTLLIAERSPEPSQRDEPFAVRGLNRVFADKGLPKLAE